MIKYSAMPIIKQARQLEDRKMARTVRCSLIEELKKTADDYGILQHHSPNPMTYSQKEPYTSQRGGNKNTEKPVEHEDTDPTVRRYDRSLSTRYSPDRVGVQVKRISDGVYQDPITNKIYDWNEGFTTEEGDVFNGHRVSLQTDLVYK